MKISSAATSFYHFLGPFIFIFAGFPFIVFPIATIIDSGFEVDLIDSIFLGLCSLIFAYICRKMHHAEASIEGMNIRRFSENYNIAWSDVDDVTFRQWPRSPNMTLRFRKNKKSKAILILLSLDYASDERFEELKSQINEWKKGSKPVS